MNYDRVILNTLASINMMENSSKVLVTAEAPKLILPDVRKQDNLMDHEKKEDTWTLPYLID